MIPLAIRWLLSLVCGISSGGLLGFALEMLVERLSYYENYSTGELLRKAMLMAVPIACGIAALETWRANSSYREVCVRACIIPLIASLSAIGLAILFAAGFKMGLFQSLSNSSPLSPERDWFCKGLVWGALFGTTAGLAHVVRELGKTRTL